MCHHCPTPPPCPTASRLPPDCHPAAAPSTRAGVGTPCYMPPELFRGEAYDTKADVWALGCVLVELLTRRRAFNAPNLNSLSVKVLRGDYGPLPPGCSAQTQELVRSLLSVQPASRPSCAPPPSPPPLPFSTAAAADGR